MNNQKISKKIRNYINEQYEIIGDFYPNMNKEEKSKLFFDSLDNFEKDKSFCVISRYISKHKIPEEINFIGVKGASILSRIQLYTDYYRSVKLQDRLCGTMVLRTFPKINLYEDLLKYTKDETVQYEMIESLKEYSDSTGYDKVLFAKCLEKKDVDYLKRFNPFFEEEYNESNVSVDLNFVKNHIEKWQKSFTFDKTLSYHKAVKFIFELNIIEPNTVKNLLLELFNQDLSIYSSTNAEDEVIKVDKMRVNQEGLYYMLKEYYEYETKKLKYTSSDKNDR